MLKISRANSAHHAVTLRLEGSVAGPWVSELRACCEDILADRQPLNLHLAEVVFLDRQGIVLLSELRARGVTLTEYSPFVAAQLCAAEGTHEFGSPG